MKREEFAQKLALPGVYPFVIQNLNESELRKNLSLHSLS